MTVEIVDATTPVEVDAARNLMREYQSLLGIDLCFQGFEDEMRALPGDYAPQRGRLLLARHAGRPVGCVALRPLNDARCEMKRLFVRPEARGLGAGRALVRRLLEEASALGYSAIVLDTLSTMVEAQALYKAFGFREVAPYCVNPIPGARFLGRSLHAAA